MRRVSRNLLRVGGDRKSTQVQVWSDVDAEGSNAHWGFAISPSSGVVLVVAQAVLDGGVLRKNHGRRWGLEGHCVRSHLSNMLT